MEWGTTSGEWGVVDDSLREGGGMSEKEEEGEKRKRIILDTHVEMMNENRE